MLRVRNGKWNYWVVRMDAGIHQSCEDSRSYSKFIFIRSFGSAANSVVYLRERFTPRYRSSTREYLRCINVEVADEERSGGLTCELLSYRLATACSGTDYVLINRHSDQSAIIYQSSKVGLMNKYLIRCFLK